MAMSSFNDVMLARADIKPTAVSMNDVEITSSVTVIIPSASVSITGFQSPSTTQSGVLFVANGSPTFSLTLPNDSAGSAVGNRILLVGGSNLTISPGQSVILILLPGIGWRPIVFGVIS
jgi:hypothetical protein